MLRSIVTLLAAASIVSTAAGQQAKSEADTPRPAAAPLPEDSPARARLGMWFSAGLGAGAAMLHCRLCQGDQQTRGTAGYLRVGTTINHFFLVGAELNGWMRNDQAGNHRVVAFSGNAYWYPNPRHGYYLKGGFGITSYRASEQEENGNTNALATRGFAGQVGGGYEVRLNPRMSFVPYLNLIGSANGTLSAEADDGTRFERNRLAKDANVLLLQLGLGVTWH